MAFIDIVVSLAFEKLKSESSLCLESLLGTLSESPFSAYPTSLGCCEDKMKKRRTL